MPETSATSSAKPTTGSQAPKRAGQKHAKLAADTIPAHHLCDAGQHVRQSAEEKTQEATDPSTQAPKRRKKKGKGDLSIRRLRALPSNQTEGDRAKFISKYEKLVFKIAIKLLKLGSERSYDELVQKGKDTLMKIGRKIEATTNVTTYVYETLWQEMRSDDEQLPRRSVKPKHCTDCEKDPTKPDKVICRIFDGRYYCPICGNRYDAPLGIVHISLDSQFDNGEDEGLALHETLAAEETSPLDEAIFTQLQELINSKLKPIERAVILQRFWTKDKLGEVGQEYAYTRERIRQIQNKAIEKLRLALYNKQPDLPFLNLRRLLGSVKPEPATPKKQTPGTAGKKKQKEGQEDMLLLF